MKTLLVHLDASPRAAVRLALAQQLAQRCGAEVTALYAVLPTMLASPWIAGEGLAAASAAIAELDAEQRARARAVYDAAASRGPVVWEEVGDEILNHGIAHRALYADLLVLGQPDPEDRHTGALPTELVPATITDSGKPALIVPYVGEFDAATERVLVAWKPTREAARALTAALPWLRSAAEVHLACEDRREDGATPMLAALKHWLALHDVTAPVVDHRVGGGSEVGEMLLSLAADACADLLVMGCYGHSRAREWVLGGATRSVLQSMTLPVLMAH